MGLFDDFKKIREGLGVKTKHTRIIEATMIGYKEDGTYFYFYSGNYEVKKIIHTDTTTVITLTEELSEGNYIEVCNVEDHYKFYDIKIYDDRRTIELLDNNNFEAEEIFLIEEVKADD